MNRVLVTGGAGFIGSCIVDQLVERGVDVIVLDNLSPSAHSSTPDYLNPVATYIWGDVRDGTAWRAALDGVDAVCHQAGKVGLGVDFSDAAGYVDDNDVGWVLGLGALHERGFTGRIVLASSMVVYGEGRYRCSLDGVVRPGPRLHTDLDAGQFEPRCPNCDGVLTAEPIPEDAPLEPRNVYAATKLHQEHLTAAFAREHDVTAGWLRYHNVYGPRMPQNTPYAGVASIFRSALERNESPLVTEDGQQRRDFVHVSDVARANVIALLGANAIKGPVNIGSGMPHSVLDMAEALAAAMGRCDGTPGWPRVTGAYRLGDVRHVFASTNHAVQLTMNPAMSFEDGMREFAEARLRDAV